jgi:hypothetical protein
MLRSNGECKGSDRSLMRNGSRGPTQIGDSPRKVSDAAREAPVGVVLSDRFAKVRLKYPRGILMAAATAL